MKRMIENIGCTGFTLIFSTLTMAQNNAIFKGGNGDGWSSVNHVQVSNNIFKGGNSDGWAAQTYVQSTAGIFKGGSGDGWDAKSYIQGTTAIFKGGSSDGWSALNFIQGSSGIFYGGQGDGWDSNNRSQTNVSIFSGGIGDGWASTYKPMGPIPVSFLYFNAFAKNNRSLLEWKTSQEINSAYFDVERSIDAIHYEFIGKVNAAGNSQVPVAYQFTDLQPLNGLNYYRLKQVDLDGRFIYTPTRLVRFSNLQITPVKMYPNPTAGMLFIVIPAEFAAGSKVINISNASGIVLNQVRIGYNSNAVIKIDMSIYPKGIYFIQAIAGNLNSVQRIIVE